MNRAPTLRQYRIQSPIPRTIMYRLTVIISTAGRGIASLQTGNTWRRRPTEHQTVELKRRHTCRPLTKSNGLRFLTGIVFFWSQRSLGSVWGKHRDLKFHQDTGKTLRYLLFQRKSAARSTAARPQAFQKPVLSSSTFVDTRVLPEPPPSESHAHYNHTGLSRFSS